MPDYREELEQEDYFIGDEYSQEDALKFYDWKEILEEV